MTSARHRFSDDTRAFAAVILTVCVAGCDSRSRSSQAKPPEPPASGVPVPSSEQRAAPAPDRPPPSPTPGATGRPLPLAASPAAAPPVDPRGGGAAHSFAVYALSRGRGVSDAALAAQQKVLELVEADRARGLTVDAQQIRIGLEGERKVCVTYADEREGARALERVRGVVQGVDLVNVVVERCAPPSSSPTKEKPQ